MPKKRFSNFLTFFFLNVFIKFCILLLFLFFLQNVHFYGLQNWPTCTSFRKGIQILKFHTIEKYIEILFFILFYVFFILWIDCVESFHLYVNRFPPSLKDSEINSNENGQKVLNSRIWTFFIQLQVFLFKLISTRVSDYILANILLELIVTRASGNIPTNFLYQLWLPIQLDCSKTGAVERPCQLIAVRLVQ